MKNLYLILILSISCGVFAQTNELSSVEHSNLTFDGVSISDIIETYGNTDQMQNLFGNNLYIEKGKDDAVEYWVDFTNNSICIKFYNGKKFNRGANDVKYYLAEVVLLKTTSRFRIKNREIKIGDNVSRLSGFKYRTVENERVYTFASRNSDSYAYIYVNTNTNRITEIGYDGNLL